MYAAGLSEKTTKERSWPTLGGKHQVLPEYWRQIGPSEWAEAAPFLREAFLLASMKWQGGISRGLIGSTIGQILRKGKNKHGGRHREKVALQQFSSLRISYILLESILTQGNINRYQYKCTNPGNIRLM